MITKERETELRKCMAEHCQRYHRYASSAESLLGATECTGHECEEDHEGEDCDCDLTCDCDDPADAHLRGAGYASLAQAEASMASTYMQMLAYEAAKP